MVQSMPGKIEKADDELSPIKMSHMDNKSSKSYFELLTRENIPKVKASADSSELKTPNK